MDERLRYDYQIPGLTHPCDLDYKGYERNQLFYTYNNYMQCHKRYLKHFRDYNELKKELASPDIYMICKRELEDFRQAANAGLTYKETVGKIKVYLPIDKMKKDIPK
jgi:hypothetical protein